MKIKVFFLNKETDLIPHLNYLNYFKQLCLETLIKRYVF